MNSIISFLGPILIGYIIGSIPFAVLVAQKKGVDIFKEGSGNPGATNVKRVVGKTAGNIVFILDFSKGMIAAGWPLCFQHNVTAGILGLVAAILGHSFSVFLKFRGGKGVATTMGGLFVLMPSIVVVGLIVWSFVYKLTQVVSLASIAFGLSLPIVGWYLKIVPELWSFACFLALFILVRHRSNIERLSRGKETKFK